MSAIDERQPEFEETNDAAWRGGDLALLALVCAIYVGVRVWRLDAGCLWFDEIFGVHAAAWHGWGGMWSFVALDLIHPPLFYAVLKVWAGAFGAGSVWWLRLLPVVASSLAVLPVVARARAGGGERDAHQVRAGAEDVRPAAAVRRVLALALRALLQLFG